MKILSTLIREQVIVLFHVFALWEQIEGGMEVIKRAGIVGCCDGSEFPVPGVSYEVSDIDLTVN